VLTSSHPSFREQSALVDVSPVQSAVLFPRIYIERSALPQVPFHASQSLSLISIPTSLSSLLIAIFPTQHHYPSLPHNQSPGTLHLSLSSLGPRSLG